MIGKTISQYEITEQIGEGGMGTVYKARDTKLKRLVALKFLSTNQTANEEQKKRFMREARAASNLDHTNIGTIYHIDETGDGELFIAMAYYPGDTLKDRIAEGALSPEFAIRVGLQMAQGLSKAHQKGIFHRDIKPANILFSEEDEVKIVDFGLAKLADASYLTKTGATMGTVLYMSPEQVQGGKVDHRADIWALGVILYEMLTGKHPFGGDYEHAVMYSIVNEDPGPLDAVLQDVPEKLAEIIEKALTKEQGNRYQDMEELIADLKVAQEQSGATQAAGAAYRLRVRKRKLKKLIRPLAPALVALIAALIYFWPTPDAEADQVSIAVLPLKGIGEATEQEWFQESMTDQLITDLTKIGGWRVISRTSIMGYKANPKPIPEIANELNVDYVIAGTILKLGEQVRVSATLIKARENENLWAQDYEREFSNILRMQAEIAQTVAQQVKVELTPEEEMRFTNVRQVIPEAQEAYLKGRYHFDKITVAGILTSVEYYQKSIAIDSTYALPYAGLAESYNFLAGGATAAGSPREMYTRAAEAVYKAIELDESLSESYRVLALLKRNVEWDFAGADRQYKRVFELNPNDAMAYILHAQLLEAQGKYEKAIKESEIARKLDPLNVFVSMNLAARYNVAGQYEKAIIESQNTLELSPNFPLAHFMVAWAYNGLGNFEQAELAIDKAYSLEEDNPSMKTFLAVYHIKRGNKQKGIDLLKVLEEKAENDYVSPFYFAQIHAGLDEPDKAMEFLEKAYEERDPFLALMLKHGLPFKPFRSLRSDSRFIELLKKIDRAVVTK